VVRDAIERGVDVRIVYDGRADPLRTRNRGAIAAAGLAGASRERTLSPSYISHNKFIVKTEHGHPIGVWTGSTNFSEGGIFGHSNVGHVVREDTVAGAYLQYWNLLAGDPELAPLKREVEALSPLPAGDSPQGTTVLFSPRGSLTALHWYAARAKAAREGLFMTFAFGINDVFKDVYRTARAPFRLALLEAKTRPMKPGPERDAEEREIQVLRNMPENVFAVGAFIRTNEMDGWVKEQLSGLNSNVRFVHDKFMLIDPLSEDPLVVSGSANFSNASTNQNDENMLVTRGNRRVADIYLGEFMRLYSHFAFRESLQWRDPADRPKFLRTDAWWRDYFGDNERATRRRFFARL
jgi:phosphatidylserine/phosphatidylglycerophosphate/cardiolipin synthase-like enzyme